MADDPAAPLAYRSLPRPHAIPVIPIVELSLLFIFTVLPLVLADYLTIFVTRVLILAFLALSFDLIWGYAGIMSFGQALFFGTAGYSVALLARDFDVTSIFIVLPVSLVIGLVVSLALGGFLLLGRRAPTTIFVALGTLTGSYAADRLARGWYYLGGQNGIPSIPSMTAGRYEFAEGPVFYYLVLAILLLVYLPLPVPGTLAIRLGAGRHPRAGDTDRLLRLPGPTTEADRVLAGGGDRRARGRPVRLPRGVRVA